MRQVHLAALDRERILVVLALETGRVEHMVRATGTDLMALDLGRVEHALSIAVRGKTVAQAAKSETEVAEGLSPEGQTVYRIALGAVRDTLERVESENGHSVVVEGTAAVLRQPEFEHAETIRELMAFLEERRRLFSLLREAYREEIHVVIGGEHRDRRMRMCSLVLARYTVLGRYSGAIGVLGPTRMDYDRTVPAVQFMAQSVGELLTKLSL